jgi:hypothetical protein
MTTLSDEDVVRIAKSVATANNVNYADVKTAPAVDSTGSEAIEIRIILTPGSSNAIIGERSARTVSQVIKEITDTGEERLPIVRYE